MQITVVCADGHSDESIVASMIHFSKIRPAALRAFTNSQRIASIPRTNPSKPRWGASSSMNHACQRRFAAQAIQKIREQTVKSAKGMQIKTGEVIGRGDMMPVDEKKEALNDDPGLRSGMTYPSMLYSQGNPEKYGIKIRDDFNYDTMTYIISAKEHVDNLPMHCRVKKPPAWFRTFHNATLLPMVSGCVAVHALPLWEGWGEVLARDVMQWTIVYGGCLLPFVGGFHFAFQMFEFSMPKDSSRFSLYRAARFAAGIGTVALGGHALAAVSVIPREACLGLLFGYLCQLSVDLLAHGYCLTPSWFNRQRIIHWGAMSICCVILLLSERMTFVGKMTSMDLHSQKIDNAKNRTTADNRIKTPDGDMKY